MELTCTKITPETPIMRARHVFITNDATEPEKALCYVGFCPEEKSISGAHLLFPSDGVDRKSMHHYVIAQSGGFFWDSLVLPQSKRSAPLFMLKDVGIRLCSGRHIVFGVFVHYELHLELTRSVFGLTQDELEALLHSYNCMEAERSAKNRFDKNLQVTRVTFGRSEKICSINHVRIPAGFPFISCGDNCPISLNGFYALLRFSMRSGCRSEVYQALLRHGASDDILMRVLDMRIFRGAGLFTANRRF